MGKRGLSFLDANSAWAFSWESALWESDQENPNSHASTSPPKGFGTPHLMAPFQKSPTKLYGMDITGNKIRPSVLNFPPALFWALPHPHQSPPSYSDLANRRNLALQLHTQRISLLRFRIFLRLWELVRFCPMIMCSVAHNLLTFCPAVWRGSGLTNARWYWPICWCGTTWQPLL